MSYFYGRNSTYSPDKKDLALARRLAISNPNAGNNQILSIDGRLFIARQSSRRGGRSQDTPTYSTSFERYFPEPTAAKSTASKPKAQSVAKPAAAKPTTTAAPKPSYTPPKIDYSKQFKAYEDRIASITGGFQKQISDLQSSMAQEREDFQKQQEELATGYQRAMARQYRPSVEGIRFADRGTGGARQKDLRMQGIRGTFGRKGDRLLKISSLNV
ncbi:MAG: hypothetical protein Unbinned8622contig1003_37 [Prokaryotic dsDNA virus sp.]|nr:MAG: hypothetical protein Unbinned8622contig1003_37 [Prokaryotic dsDNA virus sp.]|tara:strand:- start:25677 stop:26321 length:645 start_codon:yes stop_codon:yes gene_type:complete